MADDGIDTRWARDLEYDFLSQLDYSNQAAYGKSVFPYGTQARFTVIAQKAYQYGYAGSAYDDFPTYECGHFNLWRVNQTQANHEANYDFNADLDSYYLKR